MLGQGWHVPSRVHVTSVSTFHLLDAVVEAQILLVGLLSGGRHEPRRASTCAGPRGQFVILSLPKGLSSTKLSLWKAPSSP